MIRDLRSGRRAAAFGDPELRWQFNDPVETVPAAEQWIAARNAQWDAGSAYSFAVARAAGFAAEGLQRQKLSYDGVRYDVESHARAPARPRSRVRTRLRTSASPRDAHARRTR